MVFDSECLFLLIATLFIVESRPLGEGNGNNSTSAGELEKDGQLVFLQTIWRHGDRNPVMVWPNDPNQEQTWPQGLGQLTVEGIQQHVRLGQKLRQLYNGFMTSEYNSKEIYVRSSDVNRTILSAVSNLIGFYGSAESENSPHFEGWPVGYQPIPIHTIPEQYDSMRSLLKKDCKRYEEYLKMVAETPEYMQLYEENKDLLKKVQEITGDHNMSLNDLGLVADTWRIEKKYNRSETPGFTQEIYSMIEPIAFKTNDFKYGLDVAPYKGVDLKLESAKIHGGVLLWEMIDHMQKKTECLEASVMGRSKDDMSQCDWMDNLKYYVYSAHDSTMASLFTALGFPKTNHKTEGFPPYAACLAIELRKHHERQEYYVKLNYIVGDDIINVTPDVTGCGDECLLKDFVDRSQPYKVDDVKQYCASPLPTLIE